MPQDLHPDSPVRVDLQLKAGTAPDARNDIEPPTDLNRLLHSIVGRLMFGISPASGSGISAMAARM